NVASEDLWLLKVFYLLTVIPSEGLQNLFIWAAS
ncbi:hypothetical protein A2U01_0070843, partial [Trifolium medium]|nr:hypothetical protein [Trifolium medium]